MHANAKSIVSLELMFIWSHSLGRIDYYHNSRFLTLILLVRVTHSMLMISIEGVFIFTIYGHNAGYNVYTHK